MTEKKRTYSQNYLPIRSRLNKLKPEVAEIMDEVPSLSQNLFLVADFAVVDVCY